jgi:hypothetical protein
MRVASVCFVVASVLAPFEAQAQFTNPSLAARMAELEARVEKLEGNITANDLVGTYNVYLLGIAMDPPGTQATNNQMASYVSMGTAMLAPNLTGALDLTFAGIIMTEQAPSEIWDNDPASGSATGGFSWNYSNGVLTITMDPGVPFNDFDLSVIAGGQALVSAFGGAPSNNQQLLILVRQP